MAPGIHHMNARSLESLVIIMLIQDLPRTAGRIPYKKIIRKQENNAIVNRAVDEIMPHENEKVSAAKEAHGNIQSDFDENEIY